MPDTLEMSDKQLLTQAKLGRKVTCFLPGDKVTGYIAGLDFDHIFLVYEISGAINKSLLRRELIVEVQLWDEPTLDCAPEELIAIVKPFRNHASRKLDDAGKRRD